MKEINIAEEKPNHTKAIIAIVVILLCVALFAFFYKSMFSLNGSPNGGVQTERLSDVLSKTVSEEDKNNASFPPFVTGFLGKWQGSWSFNGTAVPIALAVTGVVPGVGVTAWYAIEENTSFGITGITHTTTGGVVNLPKKGNQLALEFSAPQFFGAEPTRLYFWFENPESRTLMGEFTHPQTGELIQGTFQEVL